MEYSVTTNCLYQCWLFLLFSYSINNLTSLSSLNKENTTTLLDDVTNLCEKSPAVPAHKRIAAVDNERAAVVKKKKRAEFEIQHKLLKHLDTIEEKEDKYDRFGIEVAEELRMISDPYKQKCAMRDIREVIFNYQFGHLDQTASISESSVEAKYHTFD